MKLAYFSPLNPKRSGISDYSELLLPALKVGADITLFVDGFEPTNEYLLKNFPVVDYQRDHHQLNCLQNFDAVLYHMGNDHRFHSGIHDVIKQYPGIVVFHDFALQDFFLGLSRERKNAKLYVDELEICHGREARRQAEQALAGGFQPPTLEAPLSFPLNCRLARQAEGIIVHSHWSGERLARIAPRVSVRVIPHPVKISTAERTIPSSSTIRLASFGLIIPGKGIDRALRVLAALRDSYDFHYTLVGTDNPYFDVRALIRMHKMSDRVTVTGHVSFDEFESHIANTDIAINLRERTVGETSGSLCRIMAAGVPAIVSNIGAFSELPDDCVLKIDNDSLTEPMLQAFVRKLMDDGELRRRIGANARNHVLTNHSTADSAAKYLDFIQEIVAGRSRRSFIAGVANDLSAIGITDDRLLRGVAADVHRLVSLNAFNAASAQGNGENGQPARGLDNLSDVIRSSLAAQDIASATAQVTTRRLSKIEGIDYKRAAIEYPTKLDPERYHYLFTKPFYNLANKPDKHFGDGMDAETFRHFCDFANMAVTLALPPGKKILDVGCGSGWLSEYFARLGYDVTGIDISPQLISIAQDRLANLKYDADHESPLKCKFLVHDIETDVLQETFDAVVCYDSLHHFEDEKAVIRNISRMTNYGGTVFILEGDRPHSGSATEDELLEVMRRYETLESPFDRSYLRDLLDQQGLAVVGDFVSINGLFPRDAFDENQLQLDPPKVNYLLCKKVMSKAGHKASTVPDSRHASDLFAQINVDAWPARVATGTAIKTFLHIQNCGRALWLVGRAEEKGSVMLGIRVINSDGIVVWERHGTPPLPRPLASGETVTLKFELKAPPISGSYKIKLDMVAQHVCWFEQNGSVPLILNLEVE